MFRIGYSRQIKPKSRLLSQNTFLLALICLGWWFGDHELKNRVRSPEALLVLGGAIEREAFAAEFAHRHPDLPIWVSSGTNPEYAEWLFTNAGIDPQRLNLDYQAVDTVTNFTTLVDQLKAQGIESVYLITSDDHMLRARVIAEIVLGSRDISFRPLSVPSGRPPEPIEKSVRDGLRAIVWILTGYTAADLKPLPQNSEEAETHD